jgi:TonB family protein
MADDLTANAPAFIEGQVSDETGYPLIGAEIRYLHDDSTLRTDQQGRFSISQSDMDNGIEITYQGYKSKQIVPITSENLTNIVLEEDTKQLHEIAARQMEKPEPSPPAVARQALQKQEASRPEPVVGWQKYYAYIDQNLKTPAAATESKLSGTVEVSFIINPDGQAIDIQIEKSLGYGCDEEAIRLLEKGPKWNLPTQTGIRQQISVLFN